jgi:hypothetical protein
MTQGDPVRVRDVGGGVCAKRSRTSCRVAAARMLRLTLRHDADRSLVSAQRWSGYTSVQRPAAHFGLNGGEGQAHAPPTQWLGCSAAHIAVTRFTQASVPPCMLQHRKQQTWGPSRSRLVTPQSESLVQASSTGGSSPCGGLGVDDDGEAPGATGSLGGADACPGGGGAAREQATSVVSRRMMSLMHSSTPRPPGGSRAALGS